VQCFSTFLIFASHSFSPFNDVVCNDSAQVVCTHVLLGSVTKLYSLLLAKVGVETGTSGDATSRDVKRSAIIRTLYSGS